MGLFGFFICEASQFDAWKEQAAKAQSSILRRIKTAFIVLTVLCVINMKIICSMSVVKDHLGSADSKFLGTRLLILIKESLYTLISAFTVGSDLYLTVEHHLVDTFGMDHETLHSWHFYRIQARLWELSILSISCLIVVVFNLVVWRPLNMKEAGIFTTSYAHLLDQDVLALVTGAEVTEVVSGNDSESEFSSEKESISS